MTSLAFEFVNHAKGIFLYVINDKQLFSFENNTKQGTIYRCRHRKTKCMCKVRLFNEVCTRYDIAISHNHEDNDEERFLNLRMLNEIASEKIKTVNEGKHITARELFNKCNKENNLQMDFNNRKRCIQRRLKKTLELRKKSEVIPETVVSNVPLSTASNESNPSTLTCSLNNEPQQSINFSNVTQSTPNYELDEASASISYSIRSSTPEPILIDLPTTSSALSTLTSHSDFLPKLDNFTPNNNNTQPAVPPNPITPLIFDDEIYTALNLDEIPSHQEAIDLLNGSIERIFLLDEIEPELPEIQQSDPIKLRPLLFKDKKKNRISCGFCLERDVNILLTPCGHLYFLRCMIEYRNMLYGGIKSKLVIGQEIEKNTNKIKCPQCASSIKECFLAQIPIVDQAGQLNFEKKTHMSQMFY